MNASLCEDHSIQFPIVATVFINTPMLMYVCVCVHALARAHVHMRVCMHVHCMHPFTYLCSPSL